MKMDWFKYTRHVLVWLVSTLFFFTVISADYVDVQVVPLVICLFAPFLFEPSSINPKTKWTIDLAIIAVSVCAIPLILSPQNTIDAIILFVKLIECKIIIR